MTSDIKDDNVKKFLQIILRSQIKDPSRYTPKIPDFPILNENTNLEDPRIIKFLALKIPQMEHISKKISDLDVSIDWEQYLVKYSSVSETKWITNGGSTKVPDLLYHGSAVRNWYSILINGIQVQSGTPWMTTGAAYGNGVYLSNKLEVSYNYAMSAGYKKFIVGIYEVYNADQYCKAPGYYVVPSQALEPDVSLIRLRYLIYIPQMTTQVVSALTKYLSAYWQVKSANMVAGNNKILEKRIKIEMEGLKEYDPIWDKEKRSITLANKTIITLPVNYPFDAPIINNKQILSSTWSPVIKLFSLFAKNINLEYE